MRKFMLIFSLALISSPLAAKPPSTLGVYASKYPFDKVGGIDFLSHPLVKAEVTRAVPDPKVRAFILGKTGPSSPIAFTGGRMLASGCEQHNCGARNWAILIGQHGQKPEICYHDEMTTGNKSRWYLPGMKPQMRRDPCPQG